MVKISTGQYEWRIHRAATMMRGSLIALVYEKSLELDITSPNVSPSAALTLIGTDTETVIQGVVQVHEIWGSLLEIGIGIYLLNRELGAACAVPIAFSIGQSAPSIPRVSKLLKQLPLVVLLVTGILAIPTGKAQAAWIKASEERVTTTSKTLGSIKWIKISGLNEKAFSIIQSLRSHELEVSAKFRMLIGVSFMFRESFSLE
jgi:ATP-binding cassette, subfamily C (CFTR/MRP), member 1